jgi:hypothetical protein
MTCTPIPASSLPIGLENIDDLNAGLDRVAALKAADLDSISPLELHHSISPNDLCPVCRCGAPHEVRVATPVLARTNPDFAGTDTNHPFTMTMNPAVLSTKSFTPQVPLYH